MYSAYHERLPPQNTAHARTLNPLAGLTATLAYLHEKSHADLHLRHLLHKFGGHVVRLGQQAEAEGGHGVVAPARKESCEQLPVFRRSVAPSRQPKRLPQVS